jgi:folate-dependent phosphoribosylglycinamide formyltransferase PurN
MPAPVRIARIALCNLDSLASRPAIAALFAALPGRIGLVVASRRYGGKYGGFWRQTRRNLARSGFRFAGYLSLNYVWYRPLAALGRGAGWPSLTLRQMARRYGAGYLETREPNAPEVLAQLEAFAPDLVISAHFDHVMRRRLIALPRHGVINIHTSLLPGFRGPFPVFWALRHGAPRLGVSVHAIDSEELDTGPLLAQRALAPAPGETALALDARLLRVGVELALEVIARLEAGTAAAAPQPAGAGSYYSYPEKSAVAAFHAAGFRLCSWRDAVRLLRAGPATARGPSA